MPPVASGLALAGWLEILTDLVLPRSCAGCGRQGSSWCPRCQVDLAGSLHAVCRVVPTPAPPDWPASFTGARFEGAVRRALTAYKDEDRADLAPVLLSLLVPVARRALHEAGLGAVLVPAPSSRAARRRRGNAPLHDLVRRLARSLPEEPETMDVLRLTRATRDQSRLPAEERARNLAGAMSVPSRLAERVAGRPVVLIDDLVTTGATAAEAHRALLAAGAGPVVIAAAAATVRRVPLAGGTHHD